jgi:outer membrane receptor protein involved in Fe transport
VTYFRNDLSNQITRASNDKPSPPYVYKNINEITMQGLEVEAKGRFGPVQAIANYTLQAPVVHKTAAAQVKNGKLAYIPASSGNLGVTYRPLTKVSLNVTAHAESRIYAATPFDSMASIDPRVVFNATAGVEDAGLKGLRLALSAYNVLDKQYALGGTGVAPYPQPGRWWLVTADYTF